MDNHPTTFDFPDDFALGEAMRDEVIRRILFANDPPSSEQIFRQIPKPNPYWTDNHRAWNTWVIGTINAAWEVRNEPNKNNGWGNPHTIHRALIENQLFTRIQRQQEQLDEHQKRFRHLYAQIDELSRKV